jgi:hypothetical protein
MKPRTIPCVFCKQPLNERTDKNQKPYFICDDCGTQLFVRGIVGRRLLDRVLQEATTGQRAPITDTEASSAKCDLHDLYSYIEIFCQGEMIIGDRERPRESQILFTEWADDACERIGKIVSKAANSCKKR